MRITARKSLIKKLQEKFENGKARGDQRIVDRARVILAAVQGVSNAEIAAVLQISTETVRIWIRDFLLKRMGLFEFKKSPGRPPKLTKSQKQQLTGFSQNRPSKLADFSLSALLSG